MKKFGANKSSVRAVFDTFFGDLSQSEKLSEIKLPLIYRIVERRFKDTVLYSE